MHTLYSDTPVTLTRFDSNTGTESSETLTWRQVSNLLHLEASNPNAACASLFVRGVCSIDAAGGILLTFRV